MEKVQAAIEKEPSKEPDDRELDELESIAEFACYKQENGNGERCKGRATTARAMR